MLLSLELDVVILVDLSFLIDGVESLMESSIIVVELGEAVVWGAVSVAVSLPTSKTRKANAREIAVPRRSRATITAITIPICFLVTFSFSLSSGGSKSGVTVQHDKGRRATRGTKRRRGESKCLRSSLVSSRFTVAWHNFDQMTSERCFETFSFASSWSGGSGGFFFSAAPTPWRRRQLYLSRKICFVGLTSDGRVGGFLMSTWPSFSTSGRPFITTPKRQNGPHSVQWEEHRSCERKIFISRHWPPA